MDPLTGAQLTFLIGGTVPRPAPESFARAVEEIEVVQGATPVGRDAFRVCNVATAIDRDLAPVALLQRRRPPDETNLPRDAVTRDARHDRWSVADMPGMGATQIAVAVLTLDQCEHSAPCDWG